MKHIFRWVIQSKDKREHCLWQGSYGIAYSQKRVSFRNRGHLRVGNLYNARLFKSKDEAVTYFYKRINHGGEMKGLVVRRRKLFIDNGYLAYFKNLNR